VTTTLPAKTLNSDPVAAAPRVPPDEPSQITPQLIGWAIALAVAYWLLTKVVVYDLFKLNEDSAGVVFFPSAGLGIAAMMLTRPRIWPLWIAAIAAAEGAINLQNGDGVWLTFGFVLANTLEPVVGATLVRLDTKYRRRSRHGLQIRYFLGAVVLGPLVGGLIGGAFLHWGFDSPFVSASMKWWLGDALGVLVVATPILAWTRRRVYTVPAGVVEDIAIAVAAVAVTVLPSLLWDASTVYLVLPVLMWAALRGGALGVSLAGCAFAFAVNAMVARGNVDSIVPSQSDRMLVEIQFYIGITLIAGLVLAVEASERVRAERKLREAEAANARQELMTLQAVLQERRRIVRETHDIVGHALNAMILSAAAARRVLGTDPPAAQELLGTAEEIGRDAFRDLDVALGLVEPNHELAPARGVGDLQELVERLERAGLNVALHVDGPRRALPKLVDWSAYRIVQESLTNVTKHANGSRARVDVRYEPQRVVLTISDSGTTIANGNGSGGRGLVGMQERVAMLGGRMDVGRADEGGFVVHAELPTGYD
jgi:signal transduction histidine kinase